MVVTKGLGSGSLITQGYVFWRRVKEAIKAVVSRLIPKRRSRVVLKIQVYGSVVMHSELTVPVVGERDIMKRLFLILEDEPDEDE